MVKTWENILIASIHIHSWIRNLCTVDERERTRDTFKFDALPVDEPTKAARGLPPNPKIKITLSNFDIEYLSGMSGVMLWQRILDSLVLDRFRLIFFDVRDKVRSCLAQRPQIPGHLGFVRQ